MGQRLIIEIDEYHRGQSLILRLDQAVITFGRAFDNDVILKDPYVSEHHCRLIFEDGNWYLEDSSALNGTSKLSRKIKTRLAEKEKTAFNLEDSICLGRSVIHTFDETSPVAKTWLIGKIDARNLWDVGDDLGSLFKSVFFMWFFWSLDASQGVFYEDGLIASVSLQVVAGTIIMMLWAGFWSLISKFSRKKFRWVAHFSFACRYVSLFIVLNFILGYLEFFFCQPVWSNRIDMVIGFVSIAYVFYGHLSLSTQMSFVRRLVIIGSVLGVLLGIVLLGYSLKKNDFKSVPTHEVVMFPFPTGLIPTKSIDHWGQDLNQLFKHSQ